MTADKRPPPFPLPPDRTNPGWREVGRRIAITGAPRAGKTALVTALNAYDVLVWPELRWEEARRAPDTLSPMGNPLNHGKEAEFAFRTFINELWLGEQEHVERALQEGLTLFDRALPDAEAFSRLGGLPPGNAETLARIRYDAVFIAPPWRELLDAEPGPFTWQDVLDEHAMTNAVYRECGYQPIALPFVSPQERVRFVLDTIGQPQYDFYDGI